MGVKLSRTDLAALAIVTVWGVNFALLKLALGQFDALTFNWLRFAGMLVLAWAVAGRSGLTLRRQDLARVVIVGLVGYTGYITLSIVGLSYTTAFSNALLIGAAPLFSVLLLAAWRMETIGRTQVLGVTVAFVGLLVFLSAEFGHWQAGLGDLISLVAAAAYALYTVLLKPLLGRYPIRAIIAWTLTAGGVPILAIFAPTLGAQQWDRVTTTGWLVLAWSTVVPIYVAWTVWAWITSRTSVSRTNVFLYLVPVIGGAASSVLTGEAFGPVKVAGAVIVLTGLVLVRRRVRGAATVDPAAAVMGRRAVRS
jgi:drug/metabolite transporter (DMT)-like permease